MRLITYGSWFGWVASNIKFSKRKIFLFTDTLQARLLLFTAAPNNLEESYYSAVAKTGGFVLSSALAQKSTDIARIG